MNKITYTYKPHPNGMPHGLRFDGRPYVFTRFLAVNENGEFEWSKYHPGEFKGVYCLPGNWCVIPINKT